MAERAAQIAQTAPRGPVYVNLDVAIQEQKIDTLPTIPDLARHAPPNARWALAGRNKGKLEAVRTRLASINPACAKLDLLEADTTAPETLTRVAASARVVSTTVGPYILHGEPLVAACAAAGTDYVDLTG